MKSLFTYKKIFLLHNIGFGIIFIGAFIFSYTYFADASVKKIAMSHAKEKFSEREKAFLNALEPYKNLALNIAEDPMVKSFAMGDTSRESVESMFLTLKKTLPMLMQLRYIDSSGHEQIRIDSCCTKAVGDRSEHCIIPVTGLQDKSSRNYFKKFLNLQPGKVGVSYIDLNIEHGEIDTDRNTVIRYGAPIVVNGEKVGIAVVNVNLNDLFDLLQKTTLYNIHIIDEQGRYLLHPEPDCRMYGVHDPKPDICADSADYDERILDLQHHHNLLGEDFYASHIKGLDNNQHIHMLMMFKHNVTSDEAQEAYKNILFTMLILVLVSIPTALYFSRIPEKLQREQEIELVTDRLTKLPNRLKLFRDLKDNDKYVIMILHINGFSHFNHIYGYTFADKLLVAIADFLKLFAEDHRMRVYRVSSNNFAVTFSDPNMTTLQGILKTLHTSISSERITIDDIELSLTVTIGVSDPTDVTDINEELLEAEMALQQARQEQLDYVIFSSERSLTERYRENVHWAKEIKKALEEKRVVPYYQPIYNNKNNSIEKYEVLMRIKASDGTIVSPDLFLETAKTSQLYLHLSRVMINKTFDYFRGTGIEFSINLSVFDILHGEFVDYLINKIDAFQIGKQLVIEVTESEGIENYDEVVHFLRRVKEHDCKVALDDFGSGYSNFTHLMELSGFIDYIKIDGSLVKKLCEDKNTENLIAAIKSYGNALGALIIAEYVEDETIFNKVTAMGISYSQGYFIGKPQPHLQSDREI